MTSVLETIAAWSRSAGAFPPRARKRAVEAIADTVGCMVAGGDDFSTQAVRRAVAPQISTSGESPVIGGGRAPAATAALVNGTAAHALDYDDNFHPAISHASAVMVPALLAAAAPLNISGAALVDAYIVGLEAQAAVGIGVNPSHYTLGWHSTSTCGAIGTAAGVSRLLGLDAAATARAMSMAVSSAAGVKGQFGTPAKPFHAGMAARNAVEAVAFGNAGLSGRLDILEAPQGFRALFGGPDAVGWDGLALGQPLAIEGHGVIPKRHPCCGSTHYVVDMVLDLRAQHGFTADDVASLECLVGIANARNLSYAEPQDEMQARFSMHYCVALALVQDRIGLADFTLANIARSEIRKLLPLTTMTARSREEELAGGRLPHETVIRLKNGTEFKATRLHAKGSIADPFDDNDRAAKFTDCCVWLGSTATAELYGALTHLDQQANLAFLAPVFA
ncbi:MmgE/PrpD family protein [Rhodopseudomonas sp. P2A-2r]|uniref:MmgE/PrpD family protein n=1 Tax=unclassified Rhodopseudomonas TaxID=2638247 RepID=UPI0022344229|nr:MmgE/PrpD family protein [Rhodopseudomonas sp. P2A-2r]UZE49949.1 MmgE/PrpD family protein [Rhodopseudomonas sp. P2A-2r]